MKKILGFIAISAITTVVSLPTLARNVTPLVDTPQDQCTPENKLAWYNEFRQKFKTEQAKAYELAKKYLACPSVAGEEQIATYLKNFVTLYEKASRKDQVSDLVYNKKDYAKAFEIGRQVLVDEPENLKVLIDLAYAGYASKNESFLGDALTYAKKAIQLIEANKAPESWVPYTNKEEALAYLYNALGTMTAGKNPAEALPYLIKSAQLESKLKKLPSTYGFIATAYEAGPYAKLSADYKACCEGKDETPESKLALENINQIIDRMIDAYARAVALAGNDAAYQAKKTEWMEGLTTWYKFRHNQSDAGLNEMVASILTKPLPPEPTPITSLPAAAPTNPQGGNASGSQVEAAATSPVNRAAASGNPAAASGNVPAATTEQKTTSPSAAKPAGTNKPSGSTNPGRPKTRRNHRRN